VCARRKSVRGKERAKGVEPSASAGLHAETSRQPDADGANAALANLSVPTTEPELIFIVRAWHQLPQAVRQLISGIIKLAAASRVA